MSKIERAAALSGWKTLVVAGATAIAASACCIAPLVLLTLGISGAWIGQLTLMEPYRPIFIGLTLIFLGLGFRKLYLVPRVCTSGSSCAEPRAIKRQRIVFWIVVALLTGLLAVPWFVALIVK